MTALEKLTRSCGTRYPSARDESRSGQYVEILRSRTEGWEHHTAHDSGCSLLFVRAECCDLCDNAALDHRKSTDAHQCIDLGSPNCVARSVLGLRSDLAQRHDAKGVGVREQRASGLATGNDARSVEIDKDQ